MRKKPNLLRQHELADVLRGTTRTTHRWMTAKLLPYTKVGRAVLFDVDEVMLALGRFKREASA